MIMAQPHEAAVYLLIAIVANVMLLGFVLGMWTGGKWKANSRRTGGIATNEGSTTNANGYR